METAYPKLTECDRGCRRHRFRGRLDRGWPTCREELVLLGTVWHKSFTAAFRAATA